MDSTKESMHCDAVMKTNYYLEASIVDRLTHAVVLACIAASISYLSAETLAPDPTVTAEAKQEIVAQEIELKEKQLEIEKARLEVKQSADLEMKKSQLEIEIKKLELAKARRDLMVQETNERLEMLVQGDVMFDVNSSEVRAGALSVLNQVGLVLGEYPNGNIVVTGFADATGDAQSNLQLSRKRGEAVKTTLLEKSGGTISSERVIAQGLGETQPVATNESTAGRELNRRVEITITKPLLN